MKAPEIKTETSHLLEVEGLKMHFPVRGGILRHRIGSVFAVDGISLKLKAGQTLGLVGESGCGKTTVGRCILRLYEPTEGHVWFDGKPLLNLERRPLREVRRDLQIIFQDPFESLNARHTIREILEEPFVIHGIGTPAQRKEKVADLLDKVGLGMGSLDRFPHEFSGGQRQRIGIARAIALNPKLVVCDEPVSALDVSIQSQILNLLLRLQKEMSLTFLFIAHNLSVVKHVSDHIAVMYLGKIVEKAEAENVYRNARHPYTLALLSAIPIPDPFLQKKRIVLSGDVPSPRQPPSGCRFHTRCPFAIEICKEKEPRLLPVQENDGHLVACHRSAEVPNLVSGNSGSAGAR